MRTKLRSKLTLLFMSFALLLAIPAIALADVVYINEANIGGSTSAKPGATGSAKVFLQVANNDPLNPEGDKPGCNANTSNPVSVTLGVRDPSTGLDDNSITFTTAAQNPPVDGQNPAVITACDDPPGGATIEGLKNVNYQVASNAPDKTVEIYIKSVTGGRADSKFNDDDTLRVKIDGTGPAITVNTPPAGASYNVNQVVNANYSCDDGAGNAGVKTCSGTVANGNAINTSTAGQKTFTVNAEDNLGNKSTLSRTYDVVNPDSVEPTTTASAKNADNSTYTGGSWTNQNVTVTLNAQDNDGGSGVKEIRYTTNGSDPTASSTLYSAPFTLSSTTTVKFRAYDEANNAEAVKSFQVNIDKVAPAPNCGSASTSWSATDASIACTPTDSGGSGLASSVPATLNLVTNVAEGQENANASTDSRTISDVAGNTAAAGPIGGNKLDKKAPEVLPADVNNTTWRNSNLPENFTASDGGSGLANAGDSSFSLTASAESANANTPTVVSRNVKDAVGNTTTRSVSALIDLTKPTISASVLNNPAPSDWYNNSTGGPKVHFECSDALSGIAAGACPADYTITTDGPNQGHTDSVSDRAGNSESAGVSGLKVDLTAPDVAGAPDLLATSDSGDQTDNLTNDQTPTFDITAEDGSTVKLYGKKDGQETLLGSATATNGVARITANQQLDDGEYTFYGKVTDQAGNVSSTEGIKVTIVTIDATPPDAPGLDMDAASDTGVSDSDDKTKNDKPAFSGNAEAGSTVKLYDGANLLTSIQVGAGGSWSFTPTSALSEGTHQIKATATDAADNTSNESRLSVIIDLSPPVLSAGQVGGTAGLNNWYKSVVTQTFNASDALSGVVGPTSIPVSSGAQEEGSNVTISSGAVSDVAGNTNNGVNAGPFKIDLSDPTNVAFVGSISDGSSYDFGEVPAQPTCTAEDAISGFKSCDVSGYSNAVGSHTLTATATDNAGRTATKQISYTVRSWKFAGLYAPVDYGTIGVNNLGSVVNTVKNGSTVPLKFEVFKRDAANTELTDTAIVNTPLKATPVNCTTGATEDTIELTATGATSLRYDSTSGQFIYNWQTPKKVGACYQVSVSTKDGSSSPIAQFKLK